MGTLSLPFEELVSGAASTGVLVAYHLFLRYKSRRDPSYTVQRVNERVRTKWVEGVMKQNKDILAVQTLRNSTMAATFSPCSIGPPGST